MTPRRIAAIVAHPRWPRRTVRLRLTAWYGGLFLVCRDRAARRHLRAGRRRVHRQFRRQCLLPGAGLGVPRPWLTAGTRHRGARERRRLARASVTVRAGAGTRGGALGRARLVHRRPGVAAAANYHRGRPPDLRHQPRASALRSAAPVTSSQNSPIPSTGCWHDWRRPSAPSASSSPTPPTSYAPRWPASG